MAKVYFAFVLFIAALLSRPAHAIWFRNESVEWWTNVSDVIVLADVQEVKRIAPLNEYWDSQSVTCKTRQVLDGTWQGNITFRQDYWKDREFREKENSYEVRPLLPHNKVLIFCAKSKSDGITEVVFWLNLTRLDNRRTNHAAYDNDCKWLGDGETVLALVKKRIAGQEIPKKKKRGVILDFTDLEKDDEGNVYWDFVRTADREYKKVLIDNLKNGELWAKERAMYNLVSYPGKETVDLIKPFLTDGEKTEQKIVDSKTGTRVFTVYPLRQMAFRALVLFGENTPLPKGFTADYWMGFPFCVGFEDRGYFPLADWKQDDKDN